ncbi:sugar phosphate isomerase/epimerase family protein [Rhodobium gokarnense]|uniref:Sugar phosphate isomerase/epimerase n=1 Tax=Rhodobium gokarnense TaxID=364296 RepID=A0ABT3HAN1_9HYPH|nr:sugar phosphate isomerase/epimerase family protein [Rhodobium gokarnense]MCW2307351.1 sugar phosphate isomerase/epimerase [Rhodobium gokarnense]
MLDLDRIAINQATTKTRWGFRASVEGYARHGVRQVGLWLDKLDECGLAEGKKILDANGMRVTGVNRAGPFVLDGSVPLSAAVDAARTAIDVTAELGADCLMVFPGGMPKGSRDLAGARGRFVSVAAALVDHARGTGVTLGLEPLHPMLAADRSVLNTMTEANDLCDALGPGVGIVVDVYHLWWDVRLKAEIARAGADRLVGFHVSDWLVPTRDLVFDRGMMGDGVIDNAQIRGWMEDAGYAGAVEVEIFSQADWWERDPDEVVRTSIERCQKYV